LEDKKLSQIISKNKNTAYGKIFSFDKIKTIADYQKHLPITTYEDYAPYIERIATGEQNVLTKERVIMFEPSSGSTSAKKLIPYTKGLKIEFAKAVWAWLWDLNKRFPRLKYGQVYFSITPQGIQKNYTSAGIPVGFDGDEEYFGGLFGKLISKKFCVPSSVKNIQDIDKFWEATVGYIKNAKKLRLLSVWNPTFLLIMLEKAGMPPQKLFPDLEVISCWADGNSKAPAEKLKSLFPNVYIQPKGLIATEGIMTIPIEGIGKRLTNSHFFEFQDKEGAIHLCNQLAVGETYDIILTTQGGFYRYKIGDIVLYKGNNCFDFIGKSSNVSDYFGEKLNENHVKTVIQGEGFRLLAPDGNRYVLYTETDADTEKIEKGLCENFHYEYCRKLGQLQRVEIMKIRNGERQYIENCLRFGMRLGDIKPAYLSNREGWKFERMKI